MLLSTKFQAVDSVNIFTEKNNNKIIKEHVFFSDTWLLINQDKHVQTYYT